MPTVPTSFVPQADLTGAGQIVPFEATPGQPMQNLAADQEVQMGQATTQLGNVVSRIGATIQNSIDDASAKAADTEFLKQSQDILRGQSGYFTSLGKDADLQFKSAQDALASRANGIMDGLGNTVQKSMFQQAAARHLAQFNGQMMEHRNQQVFKFEMGETKARAEQYQLQAVQDYRSRADESGPFNVARSQAQAEMAKFATMQGIPSNSAQMKDLMRSVDTQITSGVVNRLMMDNNYESALNFIKQRQDAGEIDARSGESMLSTVTAARKKQMAYELADSISKRGTLETPAGSSNYKLPVESAANITIGEDRAWTATVAAGTMVKAPADGKVIEVYDDPKHGKTVMLEFQDGTTGKFSGLDPVLLVKPGQGITQGTMIGTPEDEGGNTGTVRYTMERNGRYIDPRNANAYTQRVNPDKAVAPASLNEALNLARDISDEDVRRDTIQLLKRDYSDRAAQAKDQYDGMLYQVDKILASGKPVPAEMLGRLKPQDQKSRLEQSSLNVRYQLAIDGGAPNRDWLMEHREELSPSDFIREYDRLESLEQRGAVVDSQQIKDFFDRNGMPQYGNAQTTADKVEAMRLRKVIEDKIAAAQQAKGKPLTPKEIESEVLDPMMMDKVNIEQRGLGLDWLWRDKTGNVMSFLTEKELRDPKDPNGMRLNPDLYVMVGNEEIKLNMIPSNVVDRARAVFASNKNELGEPQPIPPTRENIAKYWVKMGRPGFVGGGR